MRIWAVGRRGNGRGEQRQISESEVGEKEERKPPVLVILSKASCSSTSAEKITANAFAPWAMTAEVNAE